MLVAAGVLLAGAAGAAPTTAFTVTGAVVRPGAFDGAALQALTSATETETYRAGGAPVTDTFTGPTLWGVLQAAGGVATDSTIKNGLLRSYVVATGSDGYQAVISTGEIAPNFGNKPDLVATGDSAGQLPNPNGFARITASGDVAGGRYVSNLASVSVGVAPPQPAAGGGLSSQITVSGVAYPVNDALAQLQALPAHTETVTYTSAAGSVTDTYTGALLWDVLNAAGIVTDPAIKNDVLRKLVSATGTDGYQVDFSLGELDPAFGNEQVLVAYSDTGGQLGGGVDGFARIVAPGDAAGGRYVSNLDSLAVFDPTIVPEPASAALLLAGLAGLAAARRAQRRAFPARLNAGVTPSAATPSVRHLDA